MKAKAKILKINSDNYSYDLGYRYNVQIFINGYYYGLGRFCKTAKEARDYAKAETKRINK